MSIIRERPLCTLRFADDIDLLGGSQEELQQITERLEKTAARYSMDAVDAVIIVRPLRP